MAHASDKGITLFPRVLWHHAWLTSVGLQWQKFGGVNETDSGVVFCGDGDGGCCGYGLVVRCLIFFFSYGFGSCGGGLVTMMIV